MIPKSNIIEDIDGPLSLISRSFSTSSFSVNVHLRFRDVWQTCAVNGLPTVSVKDPASPSPVIPSAVASDTILTRMPPKLTKCLISVKTAIALRDLGVEPAKGIFRCPECDAPVRPHGGQVTTHFEHLKRNPRCSLSGAKRGNRGRSVVTGDVRR